MIVLRMRLTTDIRFRECWRSLALLLAAFLVIAPAPAYATDLPTILATSRVSPPARVAFLEERHNPMFESPLIMEGYLEYLGPGAMRKVIESPFREAFAIEAGALSIDRDGETRQLPVSKSKSLETMLGAFEGVLAGDAERLEAVFDYKVSGEPVDWTLDLTPKSRRIARQLAGLSITGNDSGVSRILVDLRDGEQHIMHIRREAPMP